jgi:hypothetical protein
MTTDGWLRKAKRTAKASAVTAKMAFLSQFVRKGSQYDYKVK